MFAWDDLRLVLSVARGGSLAAAARARGVNHSTVFRRLTALERTVGSKLFERLAEGYRPTESGRRLIEAAERMEAEAIALDRELTGRDTRLTGQLRVTCSETFAFSFLTGEIAKFRAAYPGIAIELLVDNRVLDLSRREADLALRATRPREGELFGRKLADVSWGLFASPAYLSAHPRPRRIEDLMQHSLVGWAESAPRTAASLWLAKTLPGAAVNFRSSGIMNQFIGAREGLGVALLPTHLASYDPALVMLFGPLKDLLTETWIVTHRSLKDTARVRAFMDVVGAGVKRKLSVS